jgi:hypothetical protein
MGNAMRSILASGFWLLSLVVVLVTAADARFRFQWPQLICVGLQDGTDDHTCSQYR